MIFSFSAALVLCNISLSAVPNETYITNPNENDVYVVNTSTRTVTGTIELLPPPTPLGIVFSPDGSRIYTCNVDGTVTIIDTASNDVIGVIVIGGAIFYPAITADGKELYVTNLTLNKISVIDTETNTFIDIPLPALSNPNGIAITPDGTKAFVASNGTGKIQVIDTATKTIVTTISLPAGSGPQIISISPTEPKAYVTDDFLTSISVINTDTNALSGSIPVGFTTFDVAFSPTGAIAYATQYTSNRLFTIETATDTLIDTRTLGSGAAVTRGLAFNPNGAELYVLYDDGPLGYLAFIATDNNLQNITALTVSLDGNLFIAMSPTLVGPTSLSSKVVKNIFATQTDRINLLTWDPSSDPFILGYDVYRNGILIATVPSLKEPFYVNGELVAILPAVQVGLEYADHNRRKRVKDVYTIVAFNAYGFTSAPITVTAR